MAMHRFRAPALIPLACVVLGSALDAVFSQTCDQGGSSFGNDGAIGNTASQALLQPINGRCQLYMSDLAIDWAYEDSLKASVIVGIAAYCVEDRNTPWGSIGDFSSNSSTPKHGLLTAPKGGWSTLYGTYNDGAITSISTSTTIAGAAGANDTPFESDCTMPNEVVVAINAHGEAGCGVQVIEFLCGTVGFGATAPAPSAATPPATQTPFATGPAGVLPSNGQPPVSTPSLAPIMAVSPSPIVQTPSRAVAPPPSRAAASSPNPAPAVGPPLPVAALSPSPAASPRPVPSSPSPINGHTDGGGGSPAPAPSGGSSCGGGCIGGIVGGIVAAAVVVAAILFYICCYRHRSQQHSEEDGVKITDGVPIYDPYPVTPVKPLGAQYPAPAKISPDSWPRSDSAQPSPTSTPSGLAAYRVQQPATPASATSVTPTRQTSKLAAYGAGAAAAAGHGTVQTAPTSRSNTVQADSPLDRVGPRLSDYTHTSSANDVSANPSPASTARQDLPPEFVLDD